MTEKFLSKDKIEQMLKKAQDPSPEQICDILKKASGFVGLTPEEVALLLHMPNHLLPELFQVARQIKEDIYGNRIVMFAPLYISDYCVNQCAYCSYNCLHSFSRRKLSMEEIRQEVEEIEKLGHKRIALEVGEDPENCSMEYVLEAIKTIYQTQTDVSGQVRRINVNVASTTVENYRHLKEAGIGTYILFQETYDPEAYKKFHLGGPKKDYAYHLTAFDRAMEAGIEDVGGGVLFGLADPYFDTLGLMLHNQHLEETYNVGFHTVSVPRIRPAQGTDSIKGYPHIPDDLTFKKIVAILRLALPYVGIIISTREDKLMRKDLVDCGITQMSACSAVGVGGYANAARKDTSKNAAMPQFSLSDERTVAEIVESLIAEGLIPSWCTACYRTGRTGDRFMQLAKSGEIKNVCQPNALMTLAEYLVDYADESLQQKGFQLIETEIEAIGDQKIKAQTKENIARIRTSGKRDLYL